MAIELETVKHIARLAKLEFSESELRVLSDQLGSILDYIQKLNELDTENVEPTSHATKNRHAVREDRVVPSLPASQALANAPEAKEGHFAVPKVIG